MPTKKQTNIFIGTLSLWKTRIICSNLVLFTKIIKIFFWACQIELKAEVISCDFASLALSIHMNMYFLGVKSTAHPPIIGALGHSTHFIVKQPNTAMVNIDAIMLCLV